MMDVDGTGGLKLLGGAVLADHGRASSHWSLSWGPRRCSRTEIGYYTALDVLHPLVEFALTKKAREKMQK